MDKNNLLQKLAPVGVAALSAITFTTASAQAVVLGNLGWADGTSDFFDDVEFVPNNQFTVTFFNDLIPIPPGNAGRTDIFVSEGQFLDLGFNPGDIEPLQAPLPTGTFEFVSLFGGNPNIALYENTTNIEFIFEDDERFVLEDGATFLATINGAVDFELDEAEPFNAFWDIPGEGILKSEDVVFEFGQTSTSERGVYDAQADKVETVPEPATILGLLTISGLGLGLKRKK